MFSQVGLLCERLTEPLKVKSHLRADTVEINPKHAHHLVFEECLLGISDYRLSVINTVIHYEIVRLKMVLKSLLLSRSKLDLKVAELTIVIPILVSSAPFLILFATRVM